MGAFPGGCEADVIDTVLGDGCPMWCTVWIQLADYDGWKVLTDETQIAKRLLEHNGTYFSISRYSFFARGSLASKIVHDGECEAVEEMLKVTYILNIEFLDAVYTSFEMTSFLSAL